MEDTLGQVGAVKDGDTSMLFNGSTGIINLPGQPLPSTTSFTLEAWAYNSNAPTGQNGVIGAHNYGANSITDIQYNNGSIRFEANNPNGNNQYTVSGSYQSVWLHIVMVINGTSMIGYVNGSVISSNTIASGTFNLGSGNWVLGDWDGFFNGYLDEPAIYNYALTAAQVLAHYNAAQSAQYLFEDDLNVVDSWLIPDVVLPVDLLTAAASHWIIGDALTTDALTASDTSSVLDIALPVDALTASDQFIILDLAMMSFTDLLTVQDALNASGIAFSAHDPIVSDAFLAIDVGLWNDLLNVSDLPQSSTWPGYLNQKVVMVTRQGTVTMKIRG